MGNAVATPLIYSSRGTEVVLSTSTRCVLVANRRGTFSKAHPSMYISPWYTTGRNKNGTEIEIRHANHTGISGVVSALNATVSPCEILYPVTTSVCFGNALANSAKVVVSDNPFLTNAARTMFIIRCPSVNPIVS